MGRKPKYTAEQKEWASLAYLNREKSASEIAHSLGMGKRGRNRVRRWAKQYEAHGAEIFAESAHNQSYSKEFKTKVVKEYYSKGLSSEGLAIKYKIPSPYTVSEWIKKYNSHIELKDYDPKPEVYMANSRKTTYEERIMIVRDCLDNGRNFKVTAAKYQCSYSQVRQWVLKFEEKGEEGLLDKRGSRKKEEELTDLERANRRIKQLEREKEELRKKYELLKKAEKLERWW